MKLLGGFDLSFIEGKLIFYLISLVILTQDITMCSSNVYVSLRKVGQKVWEGGGGGGRGVGGGRKGCGCCHFFEDTTQKQFSSGVCFCLLS